MGSASSNHLKPSAIGEAALEKLGLKGKKLVVPETDMFGILVAVEGIDGSGVSTVASAIASALRSLGAKACLTKEPTYGPIGFVVWQMLRGGGGPFAIMKDPRTAALLFAADRLWHLTGEPINGFEGVLDAIVGGCIVISDRYKYSSLAYQTASIRLEERRVTFDGAPEKWVWEVNKYAPPAHILVYVDVDVETALTRIYTERFSVQISERNEYLERVRRNFHNLLEKLKKEPELNPAAAGKPEWAEWADKWAPGVTRAWLSTDRLMAYPRIIWASGKGDPIENVANILSDFINILVNELGYIKEGGGHG